jgi:hypothetical protein
VDEGAHVTSLVLSDNRLDGVFFENTRFSSLRYVRELYLNNNLIRGEIPRCFGSYFTVIEELNLAWNLFTGEIPEEIFDNMANLRVLRLDNNQLTGPVSPKLGKLTKLKFLQLHNNQLTGEIPKVGDSLTALNLCEFLPGNKFSGYVPPDAITMRIWRSEPLTKKPPSRGRSPEGQAKRRVLIQGEGGGGGGSDGGGSRPGSGSGLRPG